MLVNYFVIAILAFLKNISCQLYEHTLPIDTKYILYWNYSNTNLTARIQLINVNTSLIYNTWISFGITNMGSLSNSDLIVGWINRTTNKAILIDCHFVGDSLVVMPDLLQTWQLIGSNVTSTSIAIDFTRYINLKDIDPYNDINIIPGTPYISYAYGSPLYISNQKTFQVYIDYESAKRDLLPVPLLSSIPRTSKLTETLITQTLTPARVTLPNNRVDSFFCTSRVLNFTTNSLVHLVKYNTRASQYLSDWKLFVCVNTPATITANYQGECDPYSPFGNSTIWKNLLRTSCNSLPIMWSKSGLTTIEFPENVGLQFETSTVILQMHFSNPDLVLGAADTPVITLSFTSTLRQYTAGVLLLGQRTEWSSLVLPPNTTSIQSNFYCFADCLNTIQAKSSPNILNIFATYQHTYSYGVNVTSVIIRNGQQYAYIGKNKYYNSSNQYMLYLNKTISLNLDDQIITTCTYNTQSATDMLFGLRDEICYNLVYYYPQVSSSIAARSFRCVSSPSLNNWASLLDNLNNAGYIRRPPIGFTYATYLNSSNELNPISLVSTINPIDNYLRQKLADIYFTGKNFQTCDRTTNDVTSNQRNALIPISFLPDTYDDSGSARFNSNKLKLLLVFIVVKQLWLMI